MNEELLREILEYLRNVGEVIAIKGYDILSKQVVVNAIGNAFVILIGVGLLCLGVQQLRKINFDDLDTSFRLFGVIPLTLGTFMVAVNFIPLVNTIINPDWMVIQLVLGAVGK